VFVNIGASTVTLNASSWHFIST